MIRLLCSKQQISRLSTLAANSRYHALVVPPGDVTIPNNVPQKQESMINFKEY